jgi:hypothetical protein
VVADQCNRVLDSQLLLNSEFTLNALIAESRPRNQERERIPTSSAYTTSETNADDKTFDCNLKGAPKFPIKAPHPLRFYQFLAYLQTPFNMDQAAAHPRKCPGLNCENDASTLQCPTCLKQGLENFFCGQDCFKNSWVGNLGLASKTTKIAKASTG